MELNKITEYKRLAYQRYKYGNLLGLKASDEKSMQSLDVVYMKLNSLFGELKDLTFNPVNIFTSLEELRSDKGLVSFKKFNEEQILEYLTDDEIKDYVKAKYDNLKFAFERIKNTDKFIISSKNENKSYCFKKSNLKDIYELNIINTKDVAKTLALSNLPTYIIKIKDTDFKKNTINITYLDDYKDINVKLGDKKSINIDIIKDLENNLEDKLLNTNDIIFIKPTITPNDAKNIIIPEIDDKNLFFELTLEKTDNLLNALQTNVVNAPSFSNRNYELRVAYDIEKDEFSYIIYDTKSKTASFKNEFTNLIKSDTNLSNTIEERFKFTIVKAFQEVNDLIIANPELDCEPWSFDDFESLIEDYKKIIYAERESDNDLRSLIADTTDLINRTTSLQEELKDLKMNMDNDAVEMEW
ncbi:hypothetical protein [Agathobacter rectalis]|uniref:Uncharacterized protein n=1 Tax=Agathobacter rectalis TaxID=39491 RepID=A0A3E4YKX5_9FIRM|nr:hypothetical protein [Agathobacter rectalis]RGM75416.1 hypothetical protein DXB99_02530 [Agathobacter rectalis]